jgi:hypothetical protein
MNIEQFIHERVDPQIDWYNEKSLRNKKMFLISRITEIVLAASIPIISLSNTDAISRIIIAIIGGVIAGIMAIIGLFQFQENWISYRTTCEALRHEKYIFLVNEGKNYNEEQILSFVGKMESIISSENIQWSKTMHEKKEEANE